MKRLYQNPLVIVFNDETIILVQNNELLDPVIDFNS